MSVSPDIPARIVVLGGGSAGWMSACLLAQAWPQTEITVVESSEIGIIGVGEGSTPRLKHFFDRLKIAEHEWMPACQATYKLGIRFVDWSRRAGFASYFHPFPSQVDEHSAPAFFYHCHARRHGADLPAHPDRYFLNAYLATHRRSPHPAHHFPFHVGYGYHFDAYLLGAYLRQHAATRGVRHVDARIEAVLRHADGSIRALRSADGLELAAEMFVDCSGFRGLIHQQALGERFISFADNLYNDAAVVMPTAVGPEGPDCETRSTTLSSGWVFKIPLRHRNGNGYVYSSRHQDRDAAEAELRAHLGVSDDVPARHLSMRVGRVEHTWAHNVLAVGLSQGFIEPLEATALHLVLETVERYIATLEAPGELATRRQAYNQAIAAYIEGIRDYIVCHYRANLRLDTPYWQEAGANENLSPGLRRLLEAWFHGEDLGQTIRRLGMDAFYPSLSWHCLLGGYGVYPQQLQPAEPRIRRYHVAEIDDFIARCALNFDSHSAALAALG